MFLRVVFFGAIVIASSIGAWYYLNNYKASSKASESISKISYTVTSASVQSGGTVNVGVIVSPEGLHMSGIDISFESVGDDNLDFISASLPTGFDEQVLPDNAVATSRTDQTRKLKRLMFVSKKAEAQLPAIPVTIPLTFKVTERGTSHLSTLRINLTSSMVTGPGIPQNVFTLAGGTTPLDFVVNSNPLTPTPTPDCRAGVPQELTCDSECGTNVILKWKDVANEDGYKIYKDSQSIPIAILGKNQTVYRYKWCGDLEKHAYKVIAYNAACGSQSTTLPTMDCSCSKCDNTIPTPTQGTIQPVNTADIILKLNFPDAASSVQAIRNVKVDIMNGGALACPGCSQMVSFTRVGNYFVSPQLSFRLEQTLPYTVVVKQAITISHSYKFVYMQKNKLLNCSIGFDSACGQLLSEIDSRPMYSGDTNGFDTQSEGYNSIDKKDLSAVSSAVSEKTDQGDMNFDGISDTVDIGIVGKNFGQKGD